MTIALFDPSIASANLGDLIIRDAVYEELSSIFPWEQIVGIPTQEKIGAISVSHARRANHRFVGGTNLLSSKMLSYKQWQINLMQTIALRNVTLLGVGWWQYQGEIDCYTRSVLRGVLSRKWVHSVRDEYTKSKLQSININNVINTGCPTMWRLTPEHCRQIPKVKARTAVFTLTDYHPSPQSDLGLVRLLKRHYKDVYFWPQGSGDMAHLKSLGEDGVKIIRPSLQAYDEVLNGKDSVDFVGTRLHGGVRALQKKRRALILAVDNRAKEIAADTNLPVQDRHALQDIERWIEEPSETLINLRKQAIEQWRQQFLGVDSASVSEEETLGVA